MQEELFDIVDEHNMPLGFTKPRSLVHKDGDWHRTVHIYITNRNGEFLVHLRSPNKDLYPNMWDTKFGGHVPTGKTYSETVLEELEQEIGLKINLGQLKNIGNYSHDGITNREHIETYFYEYNEDLHKLTFNDNEVVEIKWMSPEAIMDDTRANPNNWTTSSKNFQNILSKLS